MNYKMIDLDDIYIEDYYKEFNTYITQYQAIDPFENIEEVKAYFDLCRHYEQIGEMNHYLIIDEYKEFIGCVEVQGLRDDYCEIGIWIKQSKQGQGIAVYILKQFIQFLYERYHKTQFIYTIDKNNKASYKLLYHFNYEYSHEEMFYTSTKTLDCEIYLINIT